jgi:hypothetical protein
LKNQIAEIVGKQQTIHISSGATLTSGFCTLVGIIPEIIGVVVMLLSASVTISLWRGRKKTES